MYNFIGLVISLALITKDFLSMIAGSQGLQKKRRVYTCRSVIKHAWITWIFLV